MKLRVNVNGKSYEVEVEVLEEGPRPGLAEYGLPRPLVSSSSAAPINVEKASTPPPSSVAENADDSKVYRSPISGVVVRVATAVGQTVQANDELIVLEAMKMETVLTSHCEGKVAKINANVGDPVQVRQALVEFE